MGVNNGKIQSFQVTVNEKSRSYPAGITFGEIASVYQKEYPYPIALAVRNGKIKELFKKSRSGLHCGIPHAGGRYRT